MEWNLCNGIYVMEFMEWNLWNGIYVMEFMYGIYVWNLCMEFM